jgi:methylenetetrahydrofolate reductase (NADPH)
MHGTCGDAMKDEQSFVAQRMVVISAVDLVKQINLLNQGKYLHDVMHIDNKADFVLVWQVIQRNI